MATEPAIPHPAFLHRQYEPLRRHLQRLRGPIGPTRRRRNHCRPCCGGFPSEQELGCWWDGQWEDLFVDVRECSSLSLSLPFCWSSLCFVVNLYPLFYFYFYFILFGLPILESRRLPRLLGFVWPLYPLQLYEILV